MNVAQAKDRASSLMRLHPLPLLFATLAVAERIVFRQYTHRIWEDALITLTPVRNAWDGFGLTHHVSEPRVHSFTSPISVLIPLVGEGFGHGLFALELASLGACVAAIAYAYRIGLKLGFHWWAQVLVLGYLSFDQLQVFFGMTGMETQIATAVALANAYYLLSSRWWRLGFATGLGLLCRPEFAFWIVALAVTLPFLSWRAIPRVALGGLAVAGPWFLFATVYYGSPIPNTIVAKSLSGRVAFGAFPIEQVLTHALASWRDVAPFYEMFFAVGAPVGDPMLLACVLVLMAAVLAGAVLAFLQRDIRLLAIVLFVGLFFANRAGAIVHSYFMWYLPPFMALAIVLAAHGLQALGRASGPLAATICLGLTLAYAIPLPWSLPLERAVQSGIEEDVRLRASVALNSLMGPDDTAVMEPLGYTGWAARNKTIYDYPGLGSPTAVAALKGIPPSLPGLIDKLRPTYTLLRPSEAEQLRAHYPSASDSYRSVMRFDAAPGATHISFAGYQYSTIDGTFVIYKRKD